MNEEIAVEPVRPEPLHVLRDQPVIVGTTMLQVHPIAGQQTIALQADAANTGTVYVGTTATVDASAWALAKGDTLAIDTSSSLFVIASAAGQTLHVIAGA